MSANNGYFYRLIEGFRNWLQRNREMREINAMAGSELSDLGLGRSDLYTLAAGGQATQKRIAAMAEKLGVGEEAVFAERWRAVDMARRCGHCEDIAACARYLAGEDTGDDYHRFCPNAAEFDELDMAKGGMKANTRE